MNKLVVLTYLTFVIIILMSSTIMAFDFDNVKNYDEKEKEIKIRNAFGLPFIGDDIATYKLTSNTDQCLINCKAEGTAQLFTKGYLFTEMNFEDKKGDNVQVDYKIYIEKTRTNEIQNPIQEKECISKDNCVITKITYETIYEEEKYWDEYRGEILDEGIYKWKIEGKKERGQAVDWIGEAFGETFTEWAWWDSLWLKRQEVNITGGSNSLADFTVFLNISHDADMQVDFEDIRFINGSCSGVQDTELSYEFDAVIDSSSAGVWVKIPFLNPGDNLICMYYENGAASSGEDVSNAWDGNYIGIWHLSEGTGTITKDTITQNNHSFTGDPTWTTSEFGFGNSLILDGDDGIFIPEENTTIDIISANLTIEAWFFTTASTTQQVIIQGGNNAWGTRLNAGGDMRLAKEGSAAHTTSDSYVVNSQQNLQITLASTVVNFFTNKTADSGNPGSLAADPLTQTDYRIAGANGIIGRMDEIKISDIPRDTSWLDRSYDNSDMNLFVFGAEQSSGTIGVTLLIPGDNFETTISSIAFQSSHSIVGGALINSTTVLWNPSLTLINSTLTLITGVSNTTNVTLSGLIAPGTYTWNAFTCGLDTFSNLNCSWASANRTITRIAFTEGADSFNNFINETSNEFFELNITTIPSVLSLTVNLNYNGTKILGTATCIATECSLSANIDIPLVVSGESQNKSFFWEMSIFDGTSTINENSTTQQQNVSRLHLEECSGAFTIKSLNFSTFDEQNLSRIKFLFDGDFDFWLGRGSVKRSNSFGLDNEETNLCINKTINMKTDAIINYGESINNSIYTSRFYYFDNHSISNSLQNISMYLLKSTSSTSFILKVQDENLLPVRNALIEVHRFYPGEGIFRIVQIAKTDDNGKSIGFFETETVDYKFIIKKNGVVLLETGQQKVIPETSPFTLTFNVGTDLGDPWASQNEISDLDSALVWDADTGIVTYTYIDTSGNFTQARLLVRENSLVNSTATITICNDTSSLSSATMTCTVGNSSGFYTASSFITRGAEGLDLQISFNIETFSSVAGVLGLFYGFFLILIASQMFRFSEVAGIWAITVTIFLVNIMGLIKFGNVFVSAIIFIALILTWMMEK